MLKELYNFRGEHNIKSGEEFILNGLLYNEHEKVREDFKQALDQIARLSGEGGVSPLEYLLGVLSKHFSEISKYQCKHYFELFCQLIDFAFQLEGS